MSGVGRVTHSMAAEFLRRLSRNRLAVAGGVVILLLFVVAAVPSAFAPHDPARIDIVRVLEPPSAAHPLGTDELGRDVLSRMAYGARVSLEVGFVATGIALAIGLVIGLFAGFYGTWVDAVLMRFVDMMLCFPSFFLILSVIAFLEPSIWKDYPDSLS